MEKVDLPFAMDFPLNRVANDSFVVTANDCFDREPIGWRRLDDRHILCADERKVERSRNRRRRKRQDIHQLELFLKLFLVPHAETLFLVDDDEPEFLEFDIAGDQPVGADDNINRSVPQSLNRFSLFPLRQETAQHRHADRVIGHPLPKSIVMLLG